MAKADDPVFCSTCGEPVPRERVVRGSTTCTKEHANERKLFLRALKDSSSCRYCGHRKSPPERRAAMQRFARMEKARPDLLWPEDFAKFAVVEGVDPIAAFAKFWREKDQAVEETEATSGEQQILCEDDNKKSEDGTIETVHANLEDLMRDTVDAIHAPASEEIKHWYVFRGDQFGKKGEICEIMKAPSRGGVGRNVVQIRFRDGFMPVVGRSTLRTATAEQIKKLDETEGVESTLARSGEPTGGE